MYRPPLSDDEAYDRFMQDQLDDEVFGPATPQQETDHASQTHHDPARAEQSE